MNPELFKLSLSIVGILHNSTTPYPPTTTDPPTTTNPPDPDPNPINNGVEGFHYKTLYNRTIEAYYGIPYAEPPIAELRFKPPVKIEMNWKMKAHIPSLICLHRDPVVFIEYNTQIGQEDCLYMNIFRPLQNETKKKLPVIVYFHDTENEYYLKTNRMYYPDHLMLGDIIFVTVSYRLGILGFLSTGDSVMPGNLGFKDQNMALQWINKNIGYFDGDPNQVTLIGNGFGAVSIQYHMMSPLSIGLFQKAILLSGSAIARFLDVNDKPKVQARFIADFCGLANAKNATSNQILLALQQCETNALLYSRRLLKKWGNFPWAIVRPVIEDDSISSFITDHPRKLWQNGKFASNISVILSMTENEGLYHFGQILAYEPYMCQLNAHFAEYIIEMFDVKYASKGERNEKLKSIYANYSIAAFEENSDQFIKMFNDRYYLQPLYETAQGLTLYSSEVYLFQFAYKGRYSYDEVYAKYTLGGKSYGAVHGDDKLYFINTKDLNGTNMVADEDEVFRLNYVTALLRFAIGGYSGESLFHQCTSMNITNAVCDVNIFTEEGVKHKSILDLGIEKIRFWKSIELWKTVDDNGSSNI